MMMLGVGCASIASEKSVRRESFNSGWRFKKDDPQGSEGKLAYREIKKWLLPSGNAFAKNPAQRPEGELGTNVEYTQADFDDSQWRQLNLPHDWGVEGPFTQ